MDMWSNINWSKGFKPNWKKNQQTSGIRGATRMNGGTQVKEGQIEKEGSKIENSN